MKKGQERKKKKAVLNNSRTRAQKAKVQREYSEVNKKVKKNIKADKRNYVEVLATEAEEAARQGNMRELYNITRRLSRKYGKPEILVKNKEGNTIMGEKGQIRRWKEHFEELLNRPTPQNTPDIEPAESDLQIDIEAPTKRRNPQSRRRAEE